VPRKVILVSDPGIDGAFALTLALMDSDLEVLGVAATAGNVDADQATQNVHTVIGQVDPRRWPRVGAALPVEYDVDGRKLHGPHGLGSLQFPSVQLHHQHSSDKLIGDLIREYPKEVAVVILGPLTVVARAFDRDPELPALVQRIICVGGSWREPGNASAVAEFHFYCDPLAARQVVKCGAPLTLIPLDVTRKIVLPPSYLPELPDSRTVAFLRQIVSFGIGATSNLYGVEGFHLKDVLGIAALTLSGALSTRPMVVDVETRGELTRGVCVVDSRVNSTATPNVDLAMGVDEGTVRQYMDMLLRRAT
jgi:inosine-uridine nucleoside N-ribohydrolase